MSNIETHKQYGYKYLDPKQSEEELNKFYADSIGNQTAVGIHDYIYVGLMDEDDNLLYYSNHLFNDTTSTLQIIVDQKPAMAGIDPYYLLIDRNMEDNLLKVDDVFLGGIKINTDALIKTVAILR